MAEENQLPIYRLNRHSEALSVYQTFDGVVNAVMAAAAERITQANIGRRREGDTYTEKVLSDDLDLQGFRVRIFHKVRENPNQWNDFFSGVLVDLTRVHNRNHDFIVFASEDASPESNIYSFTGGIASAVVASYGDDAFPLELVVRMIDPEKVKQAKSRMISGSFYARSNFFRGAHSISTSDAFGAIWRDIVASVRDDIRDDEDLGDLFSDRKELNCEARSSFKLRKRVSFEEGLLLIRRLEAFLGRPLTAEQRQVLELFETFKIIRSKSQKIAVRQAVLESALSYVRGEITTFDYDLCHHEYEKYLDADSFTVKYRQFELLFTDAPTAKQILDFLRTLGDDVPRDVSDLDRVRIETQNQAGPWLETKGGFFEHLHGEVSLGNGDIYFLVDRNIYKANADFLSRMREDFASRYTGDLSVENFDQLGFLDWTNIDEGPYNELHLDQPGFIVADRVTTKGIEYFDLLNFSIDRELYITQVKNGFDANIRDACSQIRNAANIIENAVRDGRATKLRELYRFLMTGTGINYADRLRRQLGQITEDQFVGLFTERRRNYLLLFKYPNDVIQSNSNIAMFEVLTTRDFIRTYDALFKVENIVR